jgi:hypothetical protein
MTATRTVRSQPRTAPSATLWVLYVVDAGLLIASGLIHLHLWDVGYRHIGTLDILFLVQAAACLVAAIALLVTRWLLVTAGSAALMAGTLVGFLLVRTVGLFGFHLHFSSGLAWTVLTVEAAGIVTLALTGWLQYTRRGRS